MRGVLASYREKFILIRKGFLTDAQFVFYEYCVHLADFDKNHGDKFGTFERVSNEQLGVSLGWSKDKVGRCLNVLVRKGLLKIVMKRIEVVDFFRFLTKYAYERTGRDEENIYLSELVAVMSSENAKMQPKDAKLQDDRPDLGTKPTSISDIGSYKVNINNTSNWKTDKNKETSLLSDDDVKWINDNIKAKN